MVVFQELSELKHGEYRCRVNLDLYDSPACASLATQAAAGRHLHALLSTARDQAVEVQLCEDGYQAWLRVEDISQLEIASQPYHAIAFGAELRSIAFGAELRSIALSRPQIQDRLPEVIAFTKKAMQQPNYYLWGGTVGPNYDCSGLMQAAFAASGIWLPRDSYQQQAFTESIPLAEAQAGDLVFFGTPEKINHVGLFLGDGYYIHSSGKEQGRNGIGIDQLSAQGDNVSRTYYQQFRGIGRVIASYCP
ncbi:MAG: C40 family peptidase [Coleofasciculus sp. D1-CHI-01]|uniref:C40 family peptidase n=1 Tax=Coleofasciculus sp. D1-CHI-01 TaxID=3068482 RepID=UPI0032FCBAE2